MASVEGLNVVNISPNAIDTSIETKSVDEVLSASKEMLLRALMTEHRYGESSLNFKPSAKADPLEDLRPLSGPAAEAADQVIEVLSGLGSNEEKLSALVDVRANAMRTGGAEAASYIDAVAIAHLLSPIGTALTHAPTAYAMPLMDMAASIVQKAASVGDTGNLMQARYETAALRETLRELHCLPSYVATSVDQLDAMIEGKMAALEALEVSEQSFEQLEAGDGSVSVKTLQEDAQSLVNRARGDGPDRPPFEHVLLGDVGARAEKLMAGVADVSTKSGEGVRMMVETLEQKALEPTANFDELQSMADTLEGMIENRADRLLASDETALRDSLSEVRTGIEAQKHCVQGREALETSALVHELREPTAKLEALANQSMPKAMAEHLDETLNQLHVCISTLEHQARAAEALFAEQVLADIQSGGEYLSIHERIEARIEGLAEQTDETSNLTLKERQDAIATLEDLDQQCWVQAFTDDIELAASPRLDAPTLMEVESGLQTSQLDADHQIDVRARIAESSATAFEALSSELSHMVTDLDTKSIDDIRSLDVPGLMREASRKLVFEDAEIFGQQLDRALKTVDQALLAKSEALLDKPLSDTETKGFHDLLKAAGYHPAMLSALTKGESVGNLLTLAGDAQPGAMTSELQEALQNLMLEHPTLDGAVKAYALQHTDSPKNMEAQLESLATRRDVMTALKTRFSEKTLATLGLEGKAVSVDTLETLVNQADTKRGLKAMDLTLLNALWGARQLEGQTFGDFRATLPESLSSLPNLESLLSTGIESRAQFEAIGRDLTGLSKGFGGTDATREVCERLLSSDDRWAAAEALTRMTRNLLGGTSFTGRQAMEGNASALKGAFEKLLYGNSVTDDVKNAIRMFLGKADETAGQSVTAQLAAFCEQEPRLSKDLALLEGRTAEFVRAKQALSTDDTRQHMIDVLKACRPNDRAVARLVNGEPKADVSGAMLSMGVIALKGILEDSSLTVAEQQDLVQGLEFQRQIDLGQMRGSSGCIKKDELGFKAKVDAFCHAATPELAQQAKADITALLESQQAEEKAMAVLYFKQMTERDNSEKVAQKFSQIYDADKVASGSEQKVLAMLQHKLVQHMSAGERVGDSIDVADAMTAEMIEQMGARLEEAQRSLSTRVIDTVQQVVSASICEAFLGGEFESMEDLIAERNKQPQLSNWDFTKRVTIEAAKLGIPSAVAEPFARQAIFDLQPDSMTAFNEGVTQDPALALRDFMIKAKTPKEMKALVTEGVFHRLSGEMLDKLEDPTKTLTLSAEKVGTVNVPIFEAGDTEVSVHLGAALRNGMSLWKGDDRAYHMILMRTGEGSAGVAVEGLLDMIEANATVNFDAGSGCDLVFRDHDACQTFFGHLLAGQSTPADLTLASTVHRATSFGIGGELNASIELDIPSLLEEDEEETLVDGLSTEPQVESEEDEEDEDTWLGFSAGVSLSGSLGWETSRNAETVEHTKVRIGHISAEASFTFAPDSLVEKGQSVAQKLGDAGYEKPQAKLESLLEANTLEASVERQFEERRKVTTTPDGRLLGAEIVRTFHFDDPEALNAAMEQMGVAPQSREAVLRDAERMGEGLTLEVVSKLPQSIVDRVATERGAVSLKGCRPVEVKLTGVDASAAHVTGLTKEHLTLASTMAGGIQTTHRYRA